MKKTILVTFLFLFIMCNLFAKNDSIYFYKNGKILYKRATNQIDSITFLPPDYYELQASKQAYNSIASNKELGIFAKMLRISGYDKQLFKKTIWAPLDSSFNEIDYKDTTGIKKILDNHISDIKITYNDGDSIITMKNDKRIAFKKTGSILYIDNKRVLNTIANENYAFHIIEDKIPYKLNVIEYLLQDTLNDGYDTFRSYIRGFESRSLTDINSYSYILRTVNFNDEKRYYTVIVPTDKACLDAYNKIFPHCKAHESNGGEAAQIRNTKYIIVRDQFYSGTIKNPVEGSIFTAFGNKYEYSDEISNDSISSLNLSNGKIIFVNRLGKFDYLDNKDDLVFETEKTSLYGSNIELKKISGNEFSGGEYLDIAPSNFSSNMLQYIHFRLSKLTPGAYNIYVTLVPPSYEDSTNLKSNKLCFYINYLDSNGKEVYIDFPKEVVYKDRKPLKVLIAENFTFSFISVGYFNYRNSLELIGVQNKMLNTETEKYDKNIRIDCINIEPVIK